MPAVQCQNCGLIVQVPDGGRRLCGCGTWLSADEVPVVVEAVATESAERWPHGDGDLVAIERLNDGYQRICKELSKAVVGQQRVLEELQVTVGGIRHALPDPFFVLATQNPIEQEGTYPLPEAQQDRFMFHVFVDYPEEEEEFRIVEMTTAAHVPLVERVLSASDIMVIQEI